MCLLFKFKKFKFIRKFGTLHRYWVRVLCPICSSDVETVNHLFFSCDMAFDLWALDGRWWGVDVPVMWIDGLRMRKGVRETLEAACLVVMWSIWNFCNAGFFSRVKPVKASIWDSN